jgi:methylmalonyl-CoA/ethylmalonyl-CoA epimerase
MEFDHAGIATDDVDALASLYGDLFDTRVVHTEQLESIRVGFLDFGGSYFELLEPTGGGPVDDYVADNGPGVHHLALRTPDIEAALARVKTSGADLIDEQPRPGAWGHDVAFIHPKSTGGILLELVEH